MPSATALVEDKIAALCWSCSITGEADPDPAVQLVRVTNEDGEDLGEHPLCENCREEMAVYD